ncbi:MAG: NAD(P)/FAD-dependent oxidoreductase [Bacteriovoracaceae bacterium]|nr:NAD(P)/FAD-dependent oxidoreductase [Bacteriovoracaceae bacterium]
MPKTVIPAYCTLMAERLQFTLSYDEDLQGYIKETYPWVVDFRIKSESLDARKANLGRAPKTHYVIEALKEGEKFSSAQEEFPKVAPFTKKPIIIGAGPAGLFCALRFAEYGVPTLILERGERAHKRMIHISKYWRKGELDQDNNVCFGEGGAGLFSDGKLITRIKSPFVQYVMDKFVHFGAPPETAWISNPHLGSNKIRQLIGKMTDELREKDHEIRYNSKVTELLYDSEKKKVIGVKLDGGEELFSDHVILATGHSAREIYYHLKESSVAMRPKNFAIGVRVEHPRELIDHIQYGDFSGPELGAARYRLSWEDSETLKGSYSFCMCPGGYVLSSGTDNNGIVVNGMSNYARNSRWSNAALVVTVEAGKDFPVDDVLGGLHFQHSVEQKAYEYSVKFATGKEVPSQPMESFLKNEKAAELPKTSCPSGLVSADLREILPEFVVHHLEKALKVFEQRMKGFASDKRALLLAPETRTSAPVTIERDKVFLNSTSHEGLYPCGEGAGHAGGITSAAVDGIKVAMKILEKEERI